MHVKIPEYADSDISGRGKRKNMKKVALHNLGCKVNGYETDAMQQLLEKSGYEIVPFAEGADIYIINTCTVTNIADRKSRQMLHRAKKMNPDAVVVAVGCYVQVAEEELRMDEDVDILIGNNNKKNIVLLLEEYEKNHKTHGWLDINEKTVAYETLHIDGTGGHTRAYVKIQDGCNQFCSYCMIPYARGRVRSRSQKDILEELERLAHNGYREVILTGIHISSYGTDSGEKDALLSLLREAQKVDGIERIRLGSLEPRIMSEKFVAGIHGLDKICPHFHLSLQSGCDDTLKRMNRRYTTDEYYEVCERIRRFYEHPAITTDIITGFPGETREEFEQTVRFVERVNFYETHVFKYSRRKGTRAAVMDNQVDESIKAERSAVLLGLNETNSCKFREYYLNREIQVLLEEEIQIDGEKYQTGYTKEYVRIACRSGMPGQIQKGRVMGFLGNDIMLMV